MKKTILIQTILVVLALVLLIFLRFNQPPFEYIPTNIRLAGEYDRPVRENRGQRPPSREDQDAQPAVIDAAPDSETETLYR